MRKPKAKKKSTRRRATSSRLFQSADPVLDYARNVLAGRIVAGRWVRLACQRHIDDLQRKDIVFVLDICNPCRRLTDERGRAKYFKGNPCPHAALYTIGFFRDVLRLNGGQFEGKPFVLAPWEAFIVGSLFGWKNLDGYRRYRWAYIEVAKGNGKSPLAAGVGHFMFVADDEPRAEIYAAATKKDQAMVLFRDAVAMRDQSPFLRERLQKSGVGEKCWNLADHKTASWFRPISADEDSQSGPRPHGALVDEIHEHKSSIVMDMLEEGFKWRRQPLMFGITNSGFDRNSPCWRVHELTIKVLTKTVILDSHFGFIASLDSCDPCYGDGADQPREECPKCDSWSTEGPHWEKANPNIGITVTYEQLRDRVTKAMANPAQENTVKRLRFCQWTEQLTRWMNMIEWDACAGAVDYDALKGRRCFAGLDLASTTDIAAAVLVFPGEPFAVLPFFWIPEDGLHDRVKRDRVPYDVWLRDGLIEATPGNLIDYRWIMLRLGKCRVDFDLRALAFDRWGSQKIVTDLVDEIGFTVDPKESDRRGNPLLVQFGQGFASMNAPTKELLNMVLGRQIAHGGNAVLRWMAQNMIVKEDPAGNLKPDKGKSTEKIDGIVALIMALDLALRPSDGGLSVYEERGIRAG